MTEPTAEHLKAAQEWLSVHDGFCLRTDDLNRSDHTAELALAALLASREQAAVRWDRTWLISCPWCGERMNAGPISQQMTHLIGCGDRREQALREENERLRRALAPEMLDALTGQRLRAEAAEARLKRVMEVLEPALKKARGVSSIYQHRSDLAAALAAAQSSEEGR